MANPASGAHALEFLLAFDGRVHYFERGYWVKFEIKRVPTTTQRPHGLRYAFTLHGPTGARLMGFDNAHAAPPSGSRFGAAAAAHDHWHRTSADAGRPYIFTTADQLLTDFHHEVARVLGEIGISTATVGEGDAATRKPQ